ncbi:MAG: aldo/keto reductase [Firmicutes bacterium]|nr:aldo/keto reductase [Bacillota bacterium]
MYYSDFKGLKLSKLGFGTMRLPLMEDGKTIDQAKTEEMVKYALDHGVNYFDTAFPYHEGKSELVVGEALSKYPRESFYLADKYPGHQIAESYDPADVFEKQLKKCRVDYFDFYLLHNVNELCEDVYKSPRWGIIDYFLEQKRLGRIKHLGFSSHAGLDMLSEFIDYCQGEMEFCQIQLNYLDWTLQDAKKKVALLNEKNIPIWVMEPVRGGKLAKPGEKAEAMLKELVSEDEDPARLAFRWLQAVPGVTVILSGMSAMDQMEKNVDTFSEERPLDEKQFASMLEVAELFKDSVPCTACRYCCEGCPMGINIPELITMYNEIRVAPHFNVGMRIDALPDDKKPSACIGCGQCAAICPQKIDIPSVLADLTERHAGMKSWAEICKERAAAAAALAAKEAE